MVRGPPGPAARGNSTELLSINERHRCRQAWWLVDEQSGGSLQDHRHLHHAGGSPSAFGRLRGTYPWR